jgi:hypothetical protein
MDPATEKKNVPPSGGSNTKDMVVLGIILFMFFAAFATMFGVSVYELVKRQKQIDLLFIGEESTQLRVTSSWTTLYDFYTENSDDEGLRSFKGSYKVVLSASTGVNFRVIDENGNVLGSTVNRGENYIESTIPFNSGGDNVSNLILQYTSTHNPVVSRIEIELD